MNFSKKLIEYMKLLNCNTNELSKESGLSYTLINRYMNNIRKPKEDSKYFYKIVDGIYQISIKKNLKFTKEEIYTSLKKSLTTNESEIDFDLFIENFNSLQKELNLTTAEIAKAIGYDSSFISRMKNKERKPANLEISIDKFRKYIISLCQNEQKKSTLLRLLNCSIDDLENNKNFEDFFTNWLCAKHIESK